MSEGSPLPVQPPLLPELLRLQAEQSGSGARFCFDQRVIGARELFEESRRIAAGLRARGIGRGDPVVLVTDNRPEYLTVFFAAAWLGAVVVPISVFLQGETLAHVFRVTCPRAAIVHARFVDRVLGALAGKQAPEFFWTVGGAVDAPGLNARDFGELLDPEGEFEAVAVGPGDPWCMMFTSGTTGPAKGVLLPHQQIASAACDAVRDLRIDERSVFYTFNPLFHLNGLIFGPMAALMARARTVVRSAFPRERTLEDLRSAGATHWCPPPFMIRALLAAEPRPGDADIALRYVATVGVTEAEARAFTQRFNCRVAVGYGTTEVGMVCSPQTARPTAAGRVSDRCTLRVVDADGHDVPPGAVGELWVRTRLPFDRMLGYYNDAEATTQAFCSDWFKTGDLVRIDRDGYVYFVDRIKESLKRRGENISTFEVEKVLMAFPGVANAAVVGYRSNPDADEEVRAFVELADPGSLAGFDYARLVQHCAENLAYFMVPRFLDLVTQLPKTAIGKVQKQQLKAAALTPTTFDVKAAAIVVQR